MEFLTNNIFSSVVVSPWKSPMPFAKDKINIAFKILPFMLLLLNFRLAIPSIYYLFTIYIPAAKKRKTSSSHSHSAHHYTFKLNKQQYFSFMKICLENL